MEVHPALRGLVIFTGIAIVVLIASYGFGQMLIYILGLGAKSLVSITLFGLYEAVFGGLLLVIFYDLCVKLGTKHKGRRRDGVGPH